MANMLRLASPLQYDSIVDGPGVRMVVWTQGCTHHCQDCHNPQTWDMQGGAEYAVDDLVQAIQEAQLQTGITFSGGEPFLQAEKLIPLAKAAKEKGYDLWAFSGFLWEDLVKEPIQKELLSYLDVLVDGRFQAELKDYRLVFKGSSNQRILDVQSSLKAGKLIVSKYDDKNIALAEQK